MRFFTSTVDQLFNWRSRHPVESLLVGVLSIGAAMAGGALLGVSILAGGAYMGVKKNISEKRGLETNKQNAELRKTVMQQQEKNIMNTQLREGFLKNTEIIDNLTAENINLKTQIIQEKIALPKAKTTIDSPQKVAKTGFFPMRSEVKQRILIQSESTEPTNFENKL
ncbi:MAG: hypothetical protein H0U73_01880 [Tatlockia sp.]|nr:hypothetical protein [Tatlockia sp.]